MTPDDLRAWQAHMGYTYDTAAAALGISRGSYADMVAGRSRTSGKLLAISRRTALACAALAAGLSEWDSDHHRTSKCGPPADEHPNPTVGI
ncbi:helix-turn-helix domain-containing protein [Xylophilus ampelinus]|uniref:helix-turn-helix domain-containing protein n=1 Tax=Xylophilus ampelinus TaxID=54067 RepID=UPI0018F27922|nr:helix-turn-helix transcriptional regulator [Xylophilus ampelinus]MCS4509799.1 helix-turn-helix domain-containing protein [Xylophilus ampelinus]